MNHQVIHECKIIVRLTDNAVFSKTGKHLSSTEILVLEGTWKGLKYNQIATENGYASEYLRNDVGPKLWKRLSQAFKENICKANVRIVLESYLFKISQINEGSIELDQKVVGIKSNHTELLEKPNENTITYKFINQNASNKNLFQAHKKTTTIHNLPHQGQILIGRELEEKKLQTWLSSEQSEPMLCIEGFGGVGKTHLMLNIAYQCLQTSKTSPQENLSKLSESSFFDVLIFTSAQSKYCTTHGLLPCPHQEKTLWDILRVIFLTLGIKGSLEPDLDTACRQIYKSLMGVRVLLMIDSLDDCDNRQELLGFLYRLPSTVKVLITSRKKTMFPSISVHPLSDSEAFRLIKYQIAQKNIFLDKETIEKLLNFAGGLPAVIIHSIGLLSSGYSIQNISTFFLQEEKEFLQFYLPESFQSLRDEPIHRLLMALALFPSSALKDGIIAVAGLKDLNCIEEGFAQLRNLFMIHQDHERYYLLPWIRSFILAELESNAQFKLSTRERWINWYIDLTNHFIGHTPLAFSHPNGSSLDDEWENIMEVIDWCFANDCHSQLQQLWKIVRLYSIPKDVQRDEFRDQGGT